MNIVNCKVRTRNEFDSGMMPLFIDKLESSKLPFTRYPSALPDIRKVYLLTNRKARHDPKLLEIMRAKRMSILGSGFLDPLYERCSRTNRHSLLLSASRTTRSPWPDMEGFVESFIFSNFKSWVTASACPFSPCPMLSQRRLVPFDSVLTIGSASTAAEY